MQRATLLVCSLIATGSAFADSTPPSALVGRAVKENRPIMTIRATATTDAEIERWCVFFSDDERRQRNFTTARVVKVLHPGTYAFKTNEELLLSEAAQHTFSMVDHKHESDEEKEPAFASSALVAEGEEYLYIVDQVETVKKIAGSEHATFSILTELDRKGIFKIVPDEEKNDFIPTVTRSEVAELETMLAPSRISQPGAGIPTPSNVKPTTQLGQAVSQNTPIAQVTAAIK